MKLGVYDRVTLSNIMAYDFQSTFLVIRQMREFREALSFDEDEHKALGIHIGNPQVNEKETAGVVYWKADQEQPKEIDVPESIHKMVVSRLRQLDEAGKLKYSHYDLYVAFVGEG